MDDKNLKELHKILIWYTNKRINNFEEAEDLVQTTLMKVFIKNTHFCCDSSMKNYTFKALNNALIDYYRKNKQIKDENYDIEKVSTWCWCYTERLEDNLFWFLDLLSESDKHILTFVDIEWWKVKNYSELNSITLETAKSRLKRARLKMKSKLNNCCNIELDANWWIVNYIKK